MSFASTTPRFRLDVASLGTDDVVSLFDKHITHIHRRRQQSTGIETEIEDEPFEADWDYIANLVASDVAGLLWDREAFYQVRLEQDNQVQAALKLFGQARELLALR